MKKILSVRHSNKPILIIEQKKKKSLGLLFLRTLIILFYSVFARLDLLLSLREPVFSYCSWTFIFELGFQALHTPSTSFNFHPLKQYLCWHMSLERSPIAWEGICLLSVIENPFMAPDGAFRDKVRNMVLINLCIFGHDTLLKIPRLPLNRLKWLKITMTWVRIEKKLKGYVGY